MLNRARREQANAISGRVVVVVKSMEPVFRWYNSCFFFVVIPGEGISSASDIGVVGGLSVSSILNLAVSLSIWAC
jgi:hypothetical protein